MAPRKNAVLDAGAAPEMQCCGSVKVGIQAASWDPSEIIPGDYRKTPGNLGHQILTRDFGDGTTEVTTLSWWESMESILQFAGPDPELARYCGEDDRFLLDRPRYV